VSGRGLLLFAAALGPSVLISPPCAAADWPVIPEAAPSPLVAVKKPIPTYDLQLGARYWFGWAQTSKRLYDPTGAFLVSRLTYGDNLYTNSGEAYGRIDTSSGFFLKGYLGAGAFTNGHLNDEDFPPGIFPYSSTTSDEKNGYLRYFSLDAGADFLRTPIFRVGAFVGYHFLNEQVSAYGCGQMATNTDVCTFLIPSYVLVITQQNNWNSLRVGVNGEVKLSDRLKFGVDAAWLPYVSLNGTDAHWLRIGTQPGAFTGAIPEDGHGTGFQLEASLSYAVNQVLDVGVGARYWHMQTNGFTHFENRIVPGPGILPGTPQPVDWKTDHYGVFLQAHLKLGPFPVGIQ
jgi:hypothetical protein